jgi:hypothetical protein
VTFWQLKPWGSIWVVRLGSMLHSLDDTREKKYLAAGNPLFMATLSDPI